jgi:hypothetical protein
MSRTYLAWLDAATSKVPKTLLPTFTAAEVGALPVSALGIANGAAQLGADKRLPAAVLPTTGLVSVDAFNNLTTQVANIAAQVNALVAASGGGSGGTGTTPPVTSIYNADGLALTSFALSPSGTSTVPATMSATWTLAKDPNVASLAIAEVGVSVLADGASDSGPYDFGTTASVTMSGASQTFSGTRDIADANGYAFTIYYRLASKPAGVASSYVKFTAQTTRRTLGAASSGGTTPTVGTFGAPTALKADPGDAHINFQWQPPTSLGGKTIASYTVSRSGSPAYSISDPAGTTSRDFLYLNNNELYTCTVAAVATDGTVGPSASITATPQSSVNAGTGGSGTSGAGVSVGINEPTIPSGTPVPIQARQSDSFLDQWGTATHLVYSTYTSKGLDNVFARLTEARIRQVRDGWGYGGNGDTPSALLKKYNIKVNLTCSPGDAGGTESLAAIQQIWNSHKSRLGVDYVGGIESWNEPGGFNGPAASGLVSRVQQWSRWLAQTVRDGYWDSVPLHGPSLADTNTASKWSSLGDLAAMGYDTATIHDYPGNQYYYNDGIADIATANGKLMVSTGRRISTETGNSTGQTGSGYTVPTIAQQGILVPNTVLMQMRRGWDRTFIYELLSQGSDSAFESQFGILNNDLSPRPAFTTLKNMNILLEDTGVAFSPGKLDIAIDGKSGNTKTLLFQKRDKTFWLFVWENAQVVNSNGSNAAVSNVALTIKFSASKDVAVYKPDLGTSMQQSTSASSITVTSTQKPLLLRIGTPSVSGANTFAATYPSTY